MHLRRQQGDLVPSLTQRLPLQVEGFRVLLLARTHKLHLQQCLEVLGRGEQILQALLLCSELRHFHVFALEGNVDLGVSGCCLLGDTLCVFLGRLKRAVCSIALCRQFFKLCLRRVQCLSMLVFKLVSCKPTRALRLPFDAADDARVISLSVRALVAHLLRFLRQYLLA
jgi:hypothetical protein